MGEGREVEQRLIKIRAQPRVAKRNGKMADWYVKVRPEMKEGEAGQELVNWFAEALSKAKMGKR